MFSGHISAFLVVWAVLGMAAVVLGVVAVRRAGKRLEATPEPVCFDTVVTGAESDLVSSSR